MTYNKEKKHELEKSGKLKLAEGNPELGHL